MKLISPQLASTDFGNARRHLGAQQERSSAGDEQPVTPVAAITPARPLGSYASQQSPKHQYALVGGLQASQNPSHFTDNQQQSNAANYYAYTATLNEDRGELIGIDTYA